MSSPRDERCRFGPQRPIALPFWNSPYAKQVVHRPTNLTQSDETRGPTWHDCTLIRSTAGCAGDLQGWSSPWSYPVFNGPRKTGLHCRCGWDRQRGVCSPAEICETRRAYSIFLLASSVYCIVAEWGQRVQRSESAYAWRNGVGLTESFSSVRAGDVESAGMLPENSIPHSHNSPQRLRMLFRELSGPSAPIQSN